MTRPSLAPQIAERILEHIRARRLPRGCHLSTQALADAFRVSRAPVGAALRRLEQMKVVRSETNRGYFLAAEAESLDAGTAGRQFPTEPEDELYFRIATDRLAGKLSDRVSEAELMRLYDVPRTRILKVLHHIATEGWIERLPGNGWEFRPLVTSRTAYEQGYQFRAAVESQALLLPTFRIDRPAFAAARAEQQAMVEGDFRRFSRDHLFRANAGFHEMLVDCGGNEFFSDAVRRINRLRRLAEYKITQDRSRLPQQSREHLRILDFLEAGERQTAADFLHAHILGASAIKSPQIE